MLNVGLSYKNILYVYYYKSCKWTSIKLSTAVVDNLLCMNFWGTQWTMVSYLEIKLKYTVFP